MNRENFHVSNDQWAPQGDPQYVPPATAPQATAPYGSPSPYGTPGSYGTAPGTPSHYPHAPAPRRSGAALASLIVGIVALLLCLIPVINVVSVIGGIVAVVLGIVGIRKVVSGVVTGKGMAVAGIITGAIATIVAVVVLALMGAALSAIDPDEFQRVVEEAVEEAEAQERGEARAPEEATTEPDATEVTADGERVDFTPLTCEDVADEAMQISDAGSGLLTIVEVSDLTIDVDRRADYDIPSGVDESLVLSCTGTADWEDGSTDPVVLELTIDGTGEAFVNYDLQ